MTLKAATALNDTVLAGASADINRTYSIDIAHALTRAVTLGSPEPTRSIDYVGAATATSTTAVTARAEYHVNRNMVLKASASRQIVESNQVG